MTRNFRKKDFVPGEAHKGKYVFYLRVSTKEQGKSGLGLEAQRTGCEKHLNGGPWEKIGEYVEIESGRAANLRRPELMKALAHCKATGAILIVAKLDRLVRNVSFLTKILDSKQPFIAADVPMFHNPATNKFMLVNLANVAEYEASLISERTKNALAERKAQGVKLGSPNPGIGQKKAVKARQLTAQDDAEKICEEIKKIKSAGFTTLKEIAKELQVRGVPVLRQTSFNKGEVKEADCRWFIKGKVDKRTTIRNIMIRGGIYDE